MSKLTQNSNQVRTFHSQSLWHMPNNDSTNKKDINRNEKDNYIIIDCVYDSE